MAHIIYRGIRKRYRMLRRFVKKRIKRIRHSLPRQLKKRLPRVISRKAFYLHLARRATRRQQWTTALSLYRRLGRTIDSAKEIRICNEVRMNVSLIERLLDLPSYLRQIDEYADQVSRNKPRIAVVTVISGSYDTVKLPAVLNPDYKYILYTDALTKYVGVYEIRPLPFISNDPTRTARFVKTNLHQLVADYDTVVWIDANMMILQDIAPLMAQFRASQAAVAAIPHPQRSSVYDEIEACQLHNKEESRALEEHARHLRELGYQNNDDLIESGLMFVNLADPRSSKFFSTWWKQLDSYSRRDQLSINYALDASGITYFPLMTRPQNTRTHPSFAIIPHGPDNPASAQLLQALPGVLVDPRAGVPFAQCKAEVIAANHERTIDIVYCVHNALDDVRLCLQSVARHRQSDNVRLIIVDDGSAEPTAEFLTEFAAEHPTWVTLHRSETGSGYTKAANRGLRLSTADFMILLNSDTIVTDGWAEKLADAAFHGVGTGIVGPLSSAASHQSIPEHKSSGNQTAINTLPAGLSVDDINQFVEENVVAYQYPLVPLVHGFCFGIRREVINTIGYFDEENFPSGYGEENDYCFRATDAGFKLALATNTYIYHAKSKSYDSVSRVALMKQGSKRLAELRGSERIRRAVLTMQHNPTLVSLRDKTRVLYASRQ